MLRSVPYIPNPSGVTAVPPVDRVSFFAACMRFTHTANRHPKALSQNLVDLTITVRVEAASPGKQPLPKSSRGPLIATWSAHEDLNNEHRDPHAKCPEFLGSQIKRDAIEGINYFGGDSFQKNWNNL